MPPAIFVGVETSDISAPADSMTFVVPDATRPRDTMILILASPVADDLVDEDALEADGWENILEHTGTAYYLWAFRREAEIGDSGQVEAQFLATLSASAIGALLVYRNLNNDADVIGATASTMTATANFVCPDQTLVRYSDMYLGIALVSSDDETVTPPAGATERLDLQGGSAIFGELTLSVFDLLPEVAGATGTKTAVVAAAESGIAASIALQADSLIGFGKSFVIDPIGAIGLPLRGV